MSDIKKIIEKLGLLPHIEGGYYRRTYESAHEICFNSKTRPINTAIYYLLESHDFSCWHRLKSDEMWHFYCGSDLIIYQIDSTGTLISTILGNPLKNPDAKPQYNIPAGTWFAAQVTEPEAFTLVGCTVAPGFEFADFEMGERDVLLAKFPQHEKIIHKLTRSKIPEMP